MPKLVQLNIRIELDRFERLKAAAEYKGKTVTSIVKAGIMDRVTAIELEQRKEKQAETV